MVGGLDGLDLVFCEVMGCWLRGYLGWVLFLVEADRLRLVIVLCWG